MNQFVISDIHGCFLTFRELLNKVGYSKDDELYLLGDYINRGPLSKEVVDFIIGLQSQGYNITALKGNHEEMVFDSIDLEDWTGGAPETLRSFGINHLKELDKKYKNWLATLSPYAGTKVFIFVHAGLNFEYTNPMQDERSMRWITNWYDSIHYDWLGDRKIIHGHTPIQRAEIEKMLANLETTKTLNIDNGCYLKDEAGFGHLCCLELNTMTLEFQQNID